VLALRRALRRTPQLLSASFRRVPGAALLVLVLVLGATLSPSCASAHEAPTGAAAVSAQAGIGHDRGDCGGCILHHGPHCHHHQAVRQDAAVKPPHATVAAFQPLAPEPARASLAASPLPKPPRA
jgi:hypothetical protein